LDPFGQSLIEGLEDAVMVTDARRNVVAWNRAMESLSGVPRAEAMGRPADVLLGFLRDVAAGALLDRALAGDVAASDEVRCELPGRGGHAWVTARYLPWRDADGRVTGAIGVHADVSEHRRRAAFVRAVEAVGQSLAASLDI
jgi:PAS domain S-box-containing protein